MKVNPFARLSQKFLEDLQKEMSSWIQDAFRGVYNPEDLMKFAKSFGIDPAKLASMAKQGVALDPYRILGLWRSASDEEIKMRYHSLLNYLHPDKSKVKGTEMLVQVVMAAYEAIKKERGLK